MAGRCGCASDQCSCTVVAGANVEVSGTGTRNNPYVISAATQVVDESGEPTGGTGERLVGEVIAYGGVSAPTGWLMCDGTAVNRSIYADLFAVLGTRFGAGDGSTTFNLPDFTGRVPIGASGDKPLGDTGGTNAVTLSSGNLPAHTHTINHDHAATQVGMKYADDTQGGGTGKRVTDIANQTGAGGTVEDFPVDLPAYTGNSGSTGSGTPVDITPAYSAVNYLIKV